LTAPSDAELDAFQWVADPHADETVAAILGPWVEGDETARFRRVDELNAVIRSWQDNRGVASWRPDTGQSASHLGEPLQKYLTVAQALPEWADRERIARAEKLFMDYGALSVTMLFCASLPECYVIPDLAAVLHATGQLEDRAEHRIRTTGAMIFPVMMNGGLTSPEASGIAQILKVRLIHATVRNLILRGSPQAAVSAKPIAAIHPADSMSRALHVCGWDLERCTIPNNQDELAYTLLTFSYVFLRAMRSQGIPLAPQGEEDYLHAWNVAGYFLGIQRELMVDTMAEAEALFTRMQARGRADHAKTPNTVDSRPHLGVALMQAMETVFPPGPAKAFPTLLTRRLIGPTSSKDLGLDGRVSWFAKTLFALMMAAARTLDAVMRLAFPDFSIARLITRAVGYRLTCALLMSQTRDLSVPARLRPGIRALIAGWGQDPKASPRMNALEDRFTTPGDWSALSASGNTPPPRPQ
jgi:hypothetical protein